MHKNRIFNFLKIFLNPLGIIVKYLANDLVCDIFNM